MSASLFCLDVLGNIYQLSTSSCQWEPLPYLGVEFKRLSASESSLWAIASDQQVYVYIYGTENPIRLKEETYENQRWNPIDGFCDKLLVSDRYHFSSADGKMERRFSDIVLPSLGWQWEAAWQIDGGLDGEPLCTEGWTYAMDFPAPYSAQKRFTSCVRRRRWVRYRRYVAVNAWSAVSPLHRDPVEEPFVDVAVGGSELAGWEADNLMVWAVTTKGRVTFRSGVGRLSPEGVSWLVIPTPMGSEARQVSCAASGLTWLTTWDGTVLVRTGMSRDTPQGTDWCQLQPPADVRLDQVSVGDSCVWAVSADKRVFFRQGVKGNEMGSNPTLARGTNWCEMVGSMSTVSVGPDNQVVALGTDGLQLYVRGRVSRSELTGHTWRPLTVPLPTPAAASRSGSVASLPAPVPAPATRHAAGSPGPLPGQGPAAGDTRSEAETAGCEHDSDSASAGDTASLRLLRLEDDEPPSPAAGRRVGPESRGWSVVAAGACYLEPSRLPPWFSGPVVDDRPGEPWRPQILELLKERDNCLRPFAGVYDQAVERSSWVHSTKCRWWTDATPQGWTPAVLELEQSGTDAGRVEFGQLTVYSNGEKAASICLSEVSAVLNSSESRRQSLLSVLTAERLRRRLPLKIWFTDEAEMEDWLDTIQTACLRLRQIEGAPSETALWAVTERGDVMVSDQQLTAVEQEMTAETHTALSQCQLVSEPAGCAPPLVRCLERGFTDNCSLVISYKIPTNCSWFSINLMTGKHLSGSKETDIALHFNPRLNGNVVVRNSQINDAWCKEERDGPQPFKPGDSGEIRIVCLKDQYEVLAPGLRTLFKHRMDQRRVTYLGIQGEVLITQVTYDAGPAAAAPEELFWRQLGGHLRRVEAGPFGVVWGLGHDQTPWVYTGATGGGQLSEHGGTGRLHHMTDTRYFYIYENQRWNPLSGFSYRGLATDRPTWSDRTGRVQMTKDTVLPPSRLWNWVSSWSVDSHVTGGVDEEGWQYAVDFPASYHGYRGLQDFVRRRRWYRKCQLKTTGPWERVNNVKLRDISMQEMDGEVHLWAVTSAGDVLHRLESRPDGGGGGGGGWQSVSTDRPLAAVSCGGHGAVWAVARDGTALMRCGVTVQRPLGIGWAPVEQPEGRKLKHISAGDSAVWAVDGSNRLYWRQDIRPVTFPMGLTWRPVADDVSHVSCGAGNQTWAVSVRPGGPLLRRSGICEQDTSGSGWQRGLVGGWSHVSGRGLKSSF